MVGLTEKLSKEANFVVQ